MSRTVTVTPPTQSHQERMLRLRRANQLRHQRANDKKAIRSKQLNALDVLHGCPDQWRNAKCSELLLCIPAVGHTKTERILFSCGISPSRSLGALTEHQRQRLAKALKPYCER